MLLKTVETVWDTVFLYSCQVGLYIFWEGPSNVSQLQWAWNWIISKQIFIKRIAQELQKKGVQMIVLRMGSKTDKMIEVEMGHRMVPQTLAGFLRKARKAVT
jgi:DNA repair photolyase